MTLTLASVFAPLAFATGRTGRLFIEFALTLAGAVIVSGFVALTLSPMMCSLLLKHQDQHSWIYNTIEGWIDAVTDGYRRLLTATLHARWLIVLVWVVVLGSARCSSRCSSPSWRRPRTAASSSGIVVGAAGFDAARTRPTRSGRSSSSTARFPKAPRTRRSRDSRRWSTATPSCA